MQEDVLHRLLVGLVGLPTNWMEELEVTMQCMLLKQVVG
jgi:hypothetical protein